MTNQAAHRVAAKVLGAAVRAGHGANLRHVSRRARKVPISKT
jgi:hypothetical protein